VYANADFGGLWDCDKAADSPITAISCKGYVIMYAGCPIIWASQLQTDFAMSTREAQYLALSIAKYNTIIAISERDQEKENLQLPMDTIPKVVCTVFEDNSGAVELAKVPKMRPRTKHINPKYLHFRKYVSDGIIQIVQVKTTEQMANIFTKNLPRDLFLYFVRRY
jgi:hypothetical protein